MAGPENKISQCSATGGALPGEGRGSWFDPNRWPLKCDERGFLYCPSCGMKTKVKVLPGTELRQFPLYCTWCKKQTIIDYHHAGA